ncbi:MAG: hypothetical protein P8L85_02510 [Rubripirellula sp.]|nr:hypothetical protein [Rubripirellula sp.]
MTRKFFLPLFAMVFVSALCITGCSTSTETTFTESELATAEEEAEDEDYMQALEADMERQQSQ